MSGIGRSLQGKTSFCLSPEMRNPYTQTNSDLRQSLPRRSTGVPVYVVVGGCQAKPDVIKDAPTSCRYGLTLSRPFGITVFRYLQRVPQRGQMEAEKLLQMDPGVRVQRTHELKVMSYAEQGRKTLGGGYQMVGTGVKV